MKRLDFAFYPLLSGVKQSKQVALCYGVSRLVTSAATTGTGVQFCMKCRP